MSFLDDLTSYVDFGLNAYQTYMDIRGTDTPDADYSRLESQIAALLAQQQQATAQAVSTTPPPGTNGSSIFSSPIVLIGLVLALFLFMRK